MQLVIIFNYLNYFSLEHHVKEMMHRAFWDILRSGLEADRPDYEPALRLLEEIKQVCDWILIFVIIYLLKNKI